MRKLFIIAVALLPLSAIAGLDYIELQVTGVVSGELDSASSTRAVDGEVVAVHLEETSSGTFTNTITVSTTDAAGVSLAENAILTLTDNVAENAIYYPRQVADTSAGADVATTNGWYSPFYLVQDRLKLSVTNGAAATTNNVTVRVVIKN